MRIAVVGLGGMGQALASRALRTGHQVTVWNRSPTKADELVAAGATWADTAAEAAAIAEVTLVVLADDYAVRSVCLGPEGVLAALTSNGVLANVSTVAPSTVRELAEAGPDGRFLEAEILGSPAAVLAGDGRFLVGGDREVAEQLRLLWNDLSAGYVHCGPVGAGAVMKLVSNLLLITGVAALAEGIAIARNEGISDDLLRTVFQDSFVLSHAARLRLEPLLDDQHPGWFTPELARKDVRLAVGLAAQRNIPVRLGPAAEQLLTTVIDGGRRWEDFAAVIEALR